MAKKIASFAFKAYLIYSVAADIIVISGIIYLILGG